MISAVRPIGWDAGHRVCGHASKCARLHGHRYTAELHARATASKHGGKALDDIGRVVDFSVLKEKVGMRIDREWDHMTMLSWDDDLILPDEEGDLEVGIVRVDFNPTAENIASHILHIFGPEELYGSGIELFKVRVWETPNCFAEATL